MLPEIIFQIAIRVPYVQLPIILRGLRCLYLLRSQAYWLARLQYHLDVDENVSRHLLFLPTGSSPYTSLTNRYVRALARRNILLPGAEKFLERTYCLRMAVHRKRADLAAYFAYRGAGDYLLSRALLLQEQPLELFKHLYSKEYGSWHLYQIALILARLRIAKKIDYMQSLHFLWIHSAEEKHEQVLMLQNLEREQYPVSEPLLPMRMQLLAEQGRDINIHRYHTEGLMGYLYANNAEKFLATLGYGSLTFIDIIYLAQALATTDNVKIFQLLQGYTRFPKILRHLFSIISTDSAIFKVIDWNETLPRMLQNDYWLRNFGGDLQLLERVVMLAPEVAKKVAQDSFLNYRSEYGRILGADIHARKKLRVAA